MDRRREDGDTSPTLRGSVAAKAVLPLEGPFVGREDELRRLSHALDVAAGGLGVTIVVTGQPGSGKTRLARQALNLARGRGFTVFEGRVLPLGVGLAYAPVVDAFRPWLRSVDSARLRSLVGDLPSLGLLFEGPPFSPPSHSEGLGDPALAKTRLFEAISRLLERLAQEAPVALFLDDVDRSDPRSLQLLAYLARALADQPALLLASYRTGAPDKNDRLRAMVSSLQREGLVREVAIPRLRPGEVEKLAHGMLGGRAPAGLLPLLEARAGGTPFFVEALITALIESGSLAPGVSEKDGWHLKAESAVALPPSVRGLVLSSLDGLGRVERRVIDVIATVGEATPHPILQTASGLKEKALLNAIARLRAWGLVTEAREGTDIVYTIDGPFIQQVANAELPEMARRRVHLAAIESLEKLRPSDLSRLARHYRGAGPAVDPMRALAVFLAAGERARALYADEEAAGYYVDALALVRGGCRVTGFADRDEELLPWLLERLGEGWERTGNGKAAVTVWDEALAERERTGNALAAVRLRCRLALAEWDRGHYDTANAHLEAGFQAMVNHEPCPELAELHFTRFQILGRLLDYVSMDDSRAELLALADRLNLPSAKAEASIVSANVCLGRGDLMGARECALQGLRMGEQTGDLAICWMANNILVIIGARMGEHRFMRDQAESGLAMARRFASLSSEVLPRQQAAFACFLAGDWDEFQLNSREAISLARRAGHQRHLACALAHRAMVLALRGDLSEVDALVSEAKMAFDCERTPDRPVSGLVHLAETAIALERGQTERALDIARSFPRQLFSMASPTGLPTMYLATGLMLLAEAQAAVGDPQAVLETAGMVLRLGPAGAPYLAALSARLEGLARQAMGQPEAALERLDQAHGTFVQMEMPFEAARVLLERARVAATLSPTLAVDSARESLLAFETLGARRYAERARRLLRAVGIALPIVRRGGRSGSSLSQRELEVARLIAAGLTTPEIASRLVLSPRTVTTHLENIYTRLGIGSRSSLAQYVIDAGLLSPDQNT